MICPRSLSNLVAETVLKLRHPKAWACYGIHREVF